MKASKKELFYNNFSDVWERSINMAETNKRLKVVFKELFKDVNLKNNKFLEVGCGLGYFSLEANKKGAIVYGIDIGQNLVSKCKKTIPTGKFYVASASELPFKDNYFDIVLCTEVIEHVENPEKAIQEIVRVTKKNGYILITTPNRIYKPFFSLLSFLKIRPYQGNEKWYYPWHLKNKLANESVLEKERYFNFIYPNRIFDMFEKFKFSKFITINQGYLARKI